MADPQIFIPQPTSDPIEDIFSDISAPPAAAKRPTLLDQTSLVAAPAAPIAAAKAAKKKFPIISILLVVLGIMAMGLLAVASYFYWQNRTKAQAPVNTNTSALEDQGEITPMNTNEVPINLNTNGMTPPPVTYIDTDYDGLSDEAEAQHKTDPNKQDTDGDGLSDREEVKVYLSDPNKQDTDGDGFWDGAEVDNGYNPKGTGYLINWQEEINKKLNINS